jgi:hypothetical protein
MPAIFTNNASTTLASGITNVQTSVTLATGTGALFPALSGANFFYATIVNGSNQIEIVKVTARSSDTLTVVRGQEGTTARAYSTGDKVECRVTAAGLANKVAYDDTTFAVSQFQVTGLIAALAAITGNLIPASSKAGFFQASAPTGWTQVTTNNDAIMRVVSGTGGGAKTSGAGLSALTIGGTVDGHSITQAELPNCSFTVNDPGHYHNMPYWSVGSSGGTGRLSQSGTGFQNVNPSPTGIGVTSGGSNTAHTHTFTSSTVNVNYVDMIICSKN